MTLTRIPGLLFGGDYNPEQWPPHEWKVDAELMAEAGVNLVTLAVFSWARLEPSQGKYELDWLAEIIEILWRRGIHVDLATGTASPPAWFVRENPQVLPVTADGVRLEFGSRQHYCPSSPVFRQAAADLTRQMAQRFGDHPALVMWHISNEYSDELQECFCEVSAAEFRDWLQRRYRDLDGLNHAWATDFWSQRYTDFAQVEPPRSAPGPINPTQQLDWRRFTSDAMLTCYRAEKAVLDEVSPGVPVTTNFMSMLKNLDYWKWAKEEDIVSDDAYPDPADPRAHVGAAMNYDLMRSLKPGRSWLLLEQAPSAVSWREVNVPKTPQQYRLGSLQTVARGADGVMHFQWRASVGGAEKFHSAMLPHGGTDSRGWQRTLAMGADLQALAPVAGHTTPAQVAIMLDWDSWWALEVDQHPSALVTWRELVRAWYEPLWNANVTVDFVPVDADLSGYRVVLAPNLYLMSDETGDNIRSFVRGGGTLVSGFFSGIVDGNDHVPPGKYPAGLREVLGLQIDEFWPLPDGQTVGLDLPHAKRATGSRWQDWIEIRDAQTIAAYTDSPLVARAAITRHAFGEGRAWYLSTLPDPDSLAALFDRILRQAGVTPAPELPNGVELCHRGPYLFLLNHNDAEVHCVLPGVAGTDLLSGNDIDGELTLAGQDVACVATSVPQEPTP